LSISGFHEEISNKVVYQYNRAAYCYTRDSWRKHCEPANCVGYGSYPWAIERIHTALYIDPDPAAYHPHVRIVYTFHKRFSFLSRCEVCQRFHCCRFLERILGSVIIQLHKLIVKFSAHSENYY